MLFGGSNFGPLARRDKLSGHLRLQRAHPRKTAPSAHRYAAVEGVGAMLAQWGGALVVADPVAIGKTTGGDGLSSS